jgi:beta-lactamase class D
MAVSATPSQNLTPEQDIPVVDQGVDAAQSPDSEVVSPEADAQKMEEMQKEIELQKKIKAEVLKEAEAQSKKLDDERMASYLKQIENTAIA